jgi:hypothetical protein
MRALDTVFLVAAAATAAGFLLSFLLPERRLRETVATGARADQMSSVPSGDSLDQVSRSLWAALSHEDRRTVLSRLALRAGLSLRPAAVWLLARLAEIPGVDLRELASRHPVDPGVLESALNELRAGGLADEHRHLTPAGAVAFERLVAARRAALEALLADWSPERHGSLADYLRQVARDFAAASPLESGPAAGATLAARGRRRPRIPKFPTAPPTITLHRYEP